MGNRFPAACACPRLGDIAEACPSAILLPNCSDTGSPAPAPSIYRTKAKPMPAPSDRRYSETHEWFLDQNGTVTIGITKFAVDELTDITYVAMKPKGTKVRSGESIGEVESVKATSDVYTAMDGEIIEVNPALEGDPSLVNTDPYGRGWLVKLKAADSKALGKLMDAAAYNAKYPTG